MAKEENYEDLFNQMYGDSKTVEEPEQPEPETDEPEEQVEEQEQTEPETDKQEQPEPEAKEPDQYSRLLDKIEDPDLKKEVQHLIQSDKSQRGRVSALTKKLTKSEEMYQNALRYREEQAQSKPTEPKEEAQASASAAPEGREEDPQLPPEVVAIKEKHPAVYQAFKTLANMENTRAVEQAKADILKELDSRFKPVEERFEREALTDEARRFETMAEELLDTEETGLTVGDVVRSQDFAKWIKGQSPRIREFYKNAASADDGILVLNKFVSDTNYLKKLDSQINDSPKESPSSSKGDELKEKREARKKASAGTDNARAVTSGKDSGDYESIFNSFWGDKGSYRTRRPGV